MTGNESVFLGSSTEGQKYGLLILEALERTRPDLHVRPWWHRDVFPNGDTYIECLERESRTATAAILVLSADDSASIRATEHRVPRDNVLFEYGLFVGNIGRRRVALVQIDDAKLPSDLHGMTIIHLRSERGMDGLADDATRRLGKWIDGLPASVRSFTRLGKQLDLMRPLLEQLSIPGRDRFDRNAAHVMRTLYLAVLTDSQSVNSGFVRLAEHELRDCVSISACDATGPAGWVGPAPYRYIASQVREYLFANHQGDRFRPYVHEWLHSALQRSLHLAQELTADKASRTQFDDTDEEPLQVGAPRLQYSRILVWTDEELGDPIAEQVISLHEAFRIPLFFLRVGDESPEKRVAYVAFEKRSGEVSVLYGDREHAYDATREDSYTRTGMIPGMGHALAHYRSLLLRQGMLLALDARQQLMTARVTGEHPLP